MEEDILSAHSCNLVREGFSPEGSQQFRAFKRRVESILYSADGTDIQHIAYGELPRGYACDLPENPVEMPDRIESAPGGHFGDRHPEAVVLKHLDGMFCLYNIQVLGKGHAGYFTEKF